MTSTRNLSPTLRRCVDPGAMEDPTEYPAPTKTGGAESPVTSLPSKLMGLSVNFQTSPTRSDIINYLYILVLIQKPKLIEENCFVCFD